MNFFKKNLTYNHKVAKEHSASLSNLVVPLLRDSLAPEVIDTDYKMQFS